MRGEARQNLIAIVIGLGIVALMFGFFIRPAVVLPVGARTLENSIGEPHFGITGQQLGKAPECMKAEGGFTCEITTPSDSSSMRQQYAVEVNSAGCWQATKARGASGPTGCINLTDYFGY